MIDKSFVISAKSHQICFRQMSQYKVIFERILTFSKTNEQIKVKHKLLKWRTAFDAHHGYALKLSFGENLKVWFHFFFIFFLLLFFTLTTEKHIKFKGLFLAFKIQRFFSPQFSFCLNTESFVVFPASQTKRLSFCQWSCKVLFFFHMPK